jgi:hypothetical protein
LVSLRDFERSQRGFAEYDLAKLKEKYQIEGLDDLISDLWFLIDLGIYDDLLEVFSNWKEPITPFSDESVEIVANTPLITLAHGNLTHTPAPFRSDLIAYINFNFLYPLLELVYTMNLKRPLKSSDVQKLFYSQIGEKIVFLLEDFDKIKESPQVTPEFFYKIRKLKWQNKEAKKIYKKLRKSVIPLAFNRYGTKEGSLDSEQSMLVPFLAGCNALKHDRGRINTEDVITAYKTLFKIMQTDLSKLINGETQSEHKGV